MNTNLNRFPSEKPNFIKLLQQHYTHSLNS